MTNETRSCLDPWSFLLVRADGYVKLCCWSEPVGNVNETDLDQIVTGSAAQSLRSSLLSGNLTENCKGCSQRGMTTREQLGLDLSRYLNDSTGSLSVSQGVLVDNQPRNVSTKKKSVYLRVTAKIKQLFKNMRTA